MALAKNEALLRQGNLLDRIMLEGDPWASSSGGAIANATLAANQVVYGILLSSLSRALWVETVEISANRLLDLQISFGGTFQNLIQTRRLVVGPGVPVAIPVRQLIRPSLQATDTTAVGEVRIRTVLDATATGGYVMANASGFQVYDDFNYSADKVGLVVGDSILNSTAGVTTKLKSTDWLVRQRFTNLGKNVRFINRAVSGTTSTDHERFRAHGRYDFPQVDYLHYQLGSNDATQGVTPATHQSNVAAMIAYKQRRYPTAKMVVYGSTPLQDNTSEAALAAIRAAGQAAVTAAADPKVSFCSLATAFDRTNVANYATTDTAGAKVHPSDSGHAQVYAVVDAFLTAQNLAL